MSELVIEYLGDEWPPIRDSLAEDEREEYLRYVAETVGFKAWEITRTHDNPVAQSIRAHQDRLVRDILEGTEP